MLTPVCLERYGLPVNFQAVLLQPHKKSATKRLREVLNSVFRHLDQVAAASLLDVGTGSRGGHAATGRTVASASRLRPSRGGAGRHVPQRPRVAQSLSSRPGVRGDPRAAAE